MTAPAVLAGSGSAIFTGFGAFQQMLRSAAAAPVAQDASRFGGMEITWNTDEVLKDLDDAARQQLPFAMAMALNMTVEDAQQAVQDRIVMRGFTIRSANSSQWLRNQVKFYRQDRAQKDKLEASLRIDGSAGFGTNDPGSFIGRSLLAFMEEGGTRQGVRAIGDGSTFGPSVVVPVRSSPTEQIPRALYPMNLGLQQRRKIAGGLGVGALRGKRGTFVVRTSGGGGLVLQRLGKGKSNVRALFFIKPRVRVAGRKFFYSTVERVVNERLGYNFGLAFAEATRTAGSKPL